MLYAQWYFGPAFTLGQVTAGDGDGVTRANGMAKTGADCVLGGRGGAEGSGWRESCGWVADAGLAALSSKEQGWMVQVIYREHQVRYCSWWW